MEVSIQLKESSQPIKHEFINTYTKGQLYCVYTHDQRTYKYPLSNIWRIVEDYGEHQTDKILPIKKSRSGAYSTAQ